MKLLLIYSILIFLCPVIRVGSERASFGEEAGMETVVLPEQISREPLVMADADSSWLRTYYYMLKVLNPVKQLDLAGDYKSWNGVRCKLLYSARNTFLSGLPQVCYTSEYMRLLSVRHSDGFYIYSLRKLII